MSTNIVVIDAPFVHLFTYASQRGVSPQHTDMVLSNRKTTRTADRGVKNIFAIVKTVTN